MTPGAIVIPVALALCNDRSPDDFRRAVSAGCAAGTRLGAAIGGARALARGIWPTLFVAPVMAAVTASVLTSGDFERLAHAMALALADASGRVGNRTRDGAHSPMPSCAAFELLRPHIMVKRGDLARLPGDVDSAAFDAADASISTVGFKPLPIARQGANAVVAFQHLLSKGIEPRMIDSVEVFVPAINVALLKRPASEADRLSRLCNMGLQFAAVAFTAELLYDPERTLEPSVPLMEFASRVLVAAAGSDLEDHWPDRWAARVVVRAGGQQYEETVIQAPFDHDAPGLLQLLQDKWRRMLSEQDLTVLNQEQPGGARYATLWQQIERRIRTPSED